MPALSRPALPSGVLSSNALHHNLRLVTRATFIAHKLLHDDLALAALVYLALSSGTASLAMSETGLD
jgi:hypothetical protein